MFHRLQPHSHRWFFASATTLAIVFALGSVACEPTVEGCASAIDCGALEAPCDDCPVIGEQLCFDGDCVERPADEIDVTVTISVDRDVNQDVGSIIYAIAARDTASGPLDCAAAIENGAVSPAVATYSTGFKALSGGSFHPDVSLGRAPDTELALVVIAKSDEAGRGSVLATGCSAAFTNADIIEVTP